MADDMVVQPADEAQPVDERQVASVGVPKERTPGEARVAVTPTVVPSLVKAGLSVLIEAGAGTASGYPDETYAAKGASVVPREDVFGADVLLCVRAHGVLDEPSGLRPDQIVIGLADPLFDPSTSVRLGQEKVVLFALELLPRITRAQAMDVLSSQATVAGYKAVLLAADASSKMFPLLTTAAGTIAPARVLVIGAGVAGLQAIATARRLGAVVQAYDVRPAAKEQVESLGARFVELPLQPGDAQDAGGYAKALTDEFYRRQRELLTQVVGNSDVVITTAMIPGKDAPVLVTAEMVDGMAPGSVVVDLAAEHGGNCELTIAGLTVETEGGVTVFGSTDLPSTVAHHASQMYAKNASTFLLYLLHDGSLRIDPADEIATATLVARGGAVVHPQVLRAVEDRGVHELEGVAAS